MSDLILSKNQLEIKKANETSVALHKETMEFLKQKGETGRCPAYMTNVLRSFCGLKKDELASLYEKEIKLPADGKTVFEMLAMLFPNAYFVIDAAMVYTQMLSEHYTSATNRFIKSRVPTMLQVETKRRMI